MSASCGMRVLLKSTKARSRTVSAKLTIQSRVPQSLWTDEKTQIVKEPECVSEVHKERSRVLWPTRHWTLSRTVAGLDSKLRPDITVGGAWRCWWGEGKQRLKSVKYGCGEPLVVTHERHWHCPPPALGSRHCICAGTFHAPQQWKRLLVTLRMDSESKAPASS